MPEKIEQIIQTFTNRLLDNISLNEYYIPAMILLFISSFALLISVGTGFAAENKEPAAKKKKCIVSTFSMSLIFFIMVPLIHHHVLTVRVSPLTSLFFFITGSMLMTGSVALNIYARHHIRNYWSDHIEIRKNHALVTDGPYGMVRHPLYSSLIFYGVGIAFIFHNLTVLLIILLIFIPMMIYRARSEEKEIAVSDLAGYKEYQERVSFLIPAVNDKISYALRILGILFFAVFLIENKVSFDKIFFISIYLTTISFLIKIKKVYFVYRIKAVFLLIIYFLSLKFPGAFYFYYMILAFNIMGIFINCPGMKLYEILNIRK